MDQGHVHVPQPGDDSSVPASHAFSTLTNIASIISGSGEQPVGQQAFQAYQHNGAHQESGGDGGEEPTAKRVKLEGDDAVNPTETAAGQANGDLATAVAAASTINAIDMQAAMLGAPLNAEQMAALQGMSMMPPEILAAAMQPGPDGQPVPLMLPDMNSFMDSATMQMAGVMPNIEALQQLPPEQLQAFLAQQSLPHAFFMPGGYGISQPSDSNPNYKNWWDEKDEQELMRMVTDGEYRTEKLGSDELNWDKLEAYFDRSQNALRKKFWTLTKGSGDASPANLAAIGIDPAATAAAAAAVAAAAAAVASSAPPMTLGTSSNHPRSRAERKNWSEDETREMGRIVQDVQYRIQLGLQEDTEDEVLWDRLAVRFNCAVQTAKRKYRHLQEQAQQFGVIPEKGKRQHFRKTVPYRWMIVSALSKIAAFEATAPQIFENIENDVELRQQLDMRIMPGTKHVPRWKIQVRKVLSADHIFINTGVKQKHETIWRLDPVALTDANADRQRQRAGVPPINLSGATQLPAAPALANTDPEAMAALHMPMLNEQTMAMLQQQHMQQLIGMQGQALQLGDGLQHLVPGLEGHSMIDPTALANMMAANVTDPATLAAMANMTDPATFAAAVGDAGAAMAAGQQQGEQQQQQQHADADGSEQRAQEEHHQLGRALWQQQMQQAEVPGAQRAGAEDNGGV